MQTSSPASNAFVPLQTTEAARFSGILHRFYQDLLEQGMPDHLAALVRRLSGEAGDHAVARRKLALVVEADPNMRNLAAILLEETGLDVVTCRSAEAALSMLEQRSLDVVFVFIDEDLEGPRGGVDLARIAGTLWPGIRIVLTANDLSAEAHGGLPEGVVTLRKPWSGMDVLVEAERALAAV